MLYGKCQMTSAAVLLIIDVATRFHYLEKQLLPKAVVELVVLASCP
jgi:hypothetical protein